MLRSPGPGYRPSRGPGQAQKALCTCGGHVQVLRDAPATLGGWHRAGGLPELPEPRAPHFREWQGSGAC